ncbi:DUF2452 domain-containing protein [Hugenholtzia roseola]|uniref:DUF2452 domain-containing protein n=1 Tax=Hugenholtzia roseola TaxID=1002 RepID=UPI000426E335|nr:DUF2452 domain-containing protein [Hugenholtzia roseola]
MDKPKPSFSLSDLQNPDFENPIDKDKIAENPAFLPYAHQVGSAVIKPTKRGVIKARALSAMEEQTQMQLDQIKAQIDLLAQQARGLQERALISQLIYEAEMSFEPLISHTYSLYQRKNGVYVLSMIAPEQWNKLPFTFIAKVKLLADHTWQVVEKGDFEQFWAQAQAQ